MTPARLNTEGKKLGPGWQTKLAVLMPCSSRSVRRWVSGESAIHPMIAARIKQVIKEATNYSI